MKKIIMLLILATVAISFSRVVNCSISSNLDLANNFNAFGFNFYQKLYDQIDPLSTSKQQNTVVSPYSLSSALSILGLGAGGETQGQIFNTLQLSTIPTDLPAQLDALNLSLMTPANSKQKLAIANAVWLQQSLTFNQKLLTQMQSIKSNAIIPTDFATDPVKATKIINDWTAQKTGNKIINLIPTDVITKSTRLVLTNAIYFNGKWQYPFYLDSTKASVFMIESNHPASSPAQMMFQQTALPYMENNELQMVLLPYANSQLAMMILLPKSTSSIDQLTKSLSNNKISELMSNLREQEVQLYLPRFKINSTFDTLSTILQSLGIKAAFSDKADFSNFTKDPLSVSAVIQQAIIEVDEKGTVATAATSISMAATANAPMSKSVIMRADHPFIFILLDQQEQLMLFMGQVKDPT